MTPLVLGSSSPRRRRLMAEAGYEFEVLSPDAEESSDASDPAGSVLRNALAKNAACRALRPQSAVISADTLVWLGGRIFGKPSTPGEAAEFLRALSGRDHTVFTGVAVSSPSLPEPVARVEASIVRFRQLDDALIAEYIEKVRPFDRAGAYDISDYGDIVVEKIFGSYTNVVGLPMETAEALLSIASIGRDGRECAGSCPAMKKTIIATAALSAAIQSPMSAAGTADLPVRVATWKGDAKGAISLYYDDGTESAFRNVVPELARRGIPGTFYICCGWFKGGDDPKLVRWGAAAKEHPQTIFLGDHTWSHGGVTNAAQFADEIKRNGALLRELAGLRPDDLLSFALPGGVRWDVTPAEQAAALAMHNEVLRHRFEPNIGGPKDGKNPNFSMRTAADAAKAFDRAEADGKWEALIFHGVGGDWIAFELEEHGKMLDDLQARADAGRLWVGSAIDVHKYETERDAAKLKVLKASDDGCDFLLAGLDPAAEGFPGPRYDVPLTIVCAPPAGWTKATVKCRRAASAVTYCADIEVPVRDGRIMFDLPVGWIEVSVLRAE